MVFYYRIDFQIDKLMWLFNFTNKNFHEFKVKSNLLKRELCVLKFIKNPNNGSMSIRIISKVLKLKTVFFHFLFEKS